MSQIITSEQWRKKGVKRSKRTPHNAILAGLVASQSSPLEERLWVILGRLNLQESCVREYYFASGRRYRADFALPDIKLLLECEGAAKKYGRHNRPKGFIEDCLKYNLATSLGWSLLRYATMESMESFPADLKQYLDNRKGTKCLPKF